MIETTPFVLDTLGVQIAEYFMISVLIILWCGIFYTLFKFLGYINTPLTEYINDAINRIGFDR